MSRRLLYHDAQESLRHYIRDNGLGAGDRLPSESAMARELNVSRPSLREATRSMQSLGIIEARPGSGLYVSAFSFGPLIDKLPYSLVRSGAALSEILLVREAMEVGLMSAVAQLAPLRALENCVELTHEMDAVEARGLPVDEVDRAFHLELYRALGNPLVDNLIELFWDVFTRLRVGVREAEPMTRGETHRRIVVALQHGDATAAVRCMRVHFDDVRHRVETLAASPAEPAS